ncbi:MAG: stage V sporulation protein B [Vulcanibacillus sp.]
MKQTFIKGAMILVVGGLITRILGTIYRIFLSRFIGAEAIGLYQMAFPTLIMLITIVTAGLPIAVSKLVAEADAKHNTYMGKRILYISLSIVVPISILISCLFYLLTPFISSYLLTDERVYLTLIAIVPIIPIISISSILRGYFQGKQNMIPTASSLIMESTFRMIFGMFLSLLLLPYGIEYASLGAMAGMVIGEFVGFLVLLTTYILNKEKRQLKKQLITSSNKNILKKISYLAIPVTTSQIFGSFAYFLEPSVVAHSLALAGISTSIATAQYGQLAGMALLIISFPTVITNSLSQSLIPAVSEANAKKDIRTIYKRLHQTLKISYIIGIGASVYLFITADLIAIVLFNMLEVSSLIKILAPFGLFLYLQKPLASTLQGLDKAKESMKNSISGSIIKTIAIFLLASKPEFGIDGVAMALNIGLVLVTFLHFRSIVKIIGYSIEIKPILKISISALLIGYISHYLINNTFHTLPNAINLSLTSFIYIIVYFYLLIFVREVKKQDIEKIPWLGSKFSKLIS